MPKILIVDDEKAIRRTLKEILEYEKYDIDEAEDGEIGLEKIEKNNYDVVILDIKMPKKDGLEVLSFHRGDMSTSLSSMENGCMIRSIRKK